MATQQISDGHLRALHTLFGIYAARSLDLPSSDVRDQRLKWAAQNIGREITSFRDLTDAEAGSLVDLLKRAVGQEVSAPVRRHWRRPFSREGAEACGLEGRRGDGRPVSIATAEDLAPIDEMWQRLGWSREQFDVWLRSRWSPLKGSTALRTLADCNRVRWALKKMLKRAGLWAPSAKRTRRAA
jgi:hypothetical protein